MNWFRERTPLLAVVVTNALPLVGVAVLGWSLAALVVVYWFELGVALAFAAVRALFAQRPPSHSSDLLVVGAVRHKRGALSVPRTDLRVQAANLPVVLVAVPAFGLVWLLSGAIAVGGLEASAASALDDRAATTAGLGLIGVTVGRSAETISEYFLAGRYEAANVQLALQSAVWPVLVVGFALVLGGLGVAAGVPAGVLLGGLVGTKCLFDLAGVYRDRLRAFDERTPVTIGWAVDLPRRTPIDDPPADPDAIVRPHPWAVLAAGPVRGVKTDAVAFPVFVGGVSVLLTVVTGELSPLLFGGGLAVAGLLVLVGLGTVDQAIRYLGMEYQLGEDLVGYDRLLGEPQWRVPTWKLARSDPQLTLVDRVFGTETLVVSHDGRSIRVPHISDVAAVRAGWEGDGG